MEGLAWCQCEDMKIDPSDQLACHHEGSESLSSEMKRQERWLERHFVRQRLWTSDAIGRTLKVLREHLNRERALTAEHLVVLDGRFKPYLSATQSFQSSIEGFISHKHDKDPFPDFPPKLSEADVQRARQQTNVTQQTSDLSPKLPGADDEGTQQQFTLKASQNDHAEVEMECAGTQTTHAAGSSGTRALGDHGVEPLSVEQSKKWTWGEHVIHDSPSHGAVTFPSKRRMWFYGWNKAEDVYRSVTQAAVAPDLHTLRLNKARQHPPCSDDNLKSPRQRRSSLQEAVLTGDETTVEKALASGRDRLGFHLDVSYCLLLAMRRHSLKVMRRLMEAGARSSYLKQWNCKELLLDASDPCHKEAWRFVLDYGELVDFEFAGGLLLQDCCRAGKTKMVDHLIRAGADVDSAETLTGETPLIAAIQSSDCDVTMDCDGDVTIHGDITIATTSTRLRNGALVERLIRVHAADVDKPDSRGHTPMHVAAMSGDAGLVRLLLAHGANVMAVDHDNSTPWCLAVRANHLHIQHLLLPADINQRDLGGKTLLHHCCLSGNLKAVHQLVSMGADVHACDFSGKLPVHYIIRETVSPFSDCAIDGRILEFLGGLINIKDTDLGNELLDRAWGGQNVHALRALKNLGVGIKDGRFQSLLISAVEDKNYDGVLLLLGIGVSPNEVTKGYSAIWHACSSNNSGMLGVLLASQTDATLADVSPPGEKSGAEIAVANRNLAIIHLLFNAGCQFLSLPEFDLDGELLIPEQEHYSADYDEHVLEACTNILQNDKNYFYVLRQLRERCCSPRTLQHCCRQVIRQNLGHAMDVDSKIAKLPVPEILRDFILNKHMDDLF